jgi:hypothetical protein
LYFKGLRKPAEAFTEADLGFRFGLRDAKPFFLPSNSVFTTFFALLATVGLFIFILISGLIAVLWDYWTV